MWNGRVVEPVSHDEHLSAHDDEREGCVLRVCAENKEYADREFTKCKKECRRPSVRPPGERKHIFEFIAMLVVLETTIEQRDSNNDAQEKVRKEGEELDREWVEHMKIVYPNTNFLSPRLTNK